MKQERGVVRIGLPLLVLALLLLVWELSVRVSGIQAYILPAPSAVLRAFVADFQSLCYHAGYTLTETLVGLLLATGLGSAIAIFMDALPHFRHAVYPILVATQTVPVIVLAPIFIIYLGFGMAPKVLTVVLMCFFPIAVSFADAMGGVDARRVNLLRAMGAGRYKIYTLVKIPGALPAFFSGLKLAATYSISGAVVGEWLSSSRGLGYYMLRLKNGYQLDRVFATVLMIALLSLLMTMAVKLLARLAIKPKQII